MTGCERVLARLERGPATAAELYAETYCVVHSRIAELRKRGHRIETFRIPDKTGAASYGYRLTTCTEGPSVTTLTDVTMTPPVPDHAGDAASLEASSVQLSMAVAA